MPKPNDVVASVLFQSMAPHIQSISQAQLVYELCKVKDDEDLRLDRREVSVAFSWANTPQGYGFWCNLGQEHSESVRRNRGA